MAAGAGALPLLSVGELLRLSDMPAEETLPYHSLVVGGTYTLELLYNTQSLSEETAPHNVEVRVSRITITKKGGGGATRVEFYEHDTLRKLKISSAPEWATPYFETGDYKGQYSIHSYHPHIGKIDPEDSSDEDAKPKQYIALQRIFPAKYFDVIKPKKGGKRKKGVRKTRGKRTRSRK
jgi:hypothetical protein